MTTAASGLKDLHELHLRLKNVQDQLDRGPRQIKVRHTIVEKKQTELEEQKDQLKKAKMSADQKNLQLRTNESKLLEIKAKLNAASSNREYDVFKSQIEADTMATSVLEDEILESLEKVDEVQQTIKKTEVDLAAAKEQEKKVTAEIAAGEPALKQEAAELQGSLQAAERELPGTVLEVYRRLVQAHGASALAGVHKKACTACNAILSPQLCVEVNTGKIIFCRSCGRMLYRMEELRVES